MSTLPDRLRALARLRGIRELALLLQVSAFASTVPLLTRLPLPRLAALLTRPPRGRRVAADAAERLALLVSLAAQVFHPLVRPGCLTRGVTLYWFLRRAGFDVELRFGLDALDPARPDGHCWVALDGVPFLERDDPRPRFAELYRLPLARA